MNRVPLAREAVTFRLKVQRRKTMEGKVSNRETVQAIYEAFGRGDQDGEGRMINARPFYATCRIGRLPNGADALDGLRGTVAAARGSFGALGIERVSHARWIGSPQRQENVSNAVPPRSARTVDRLMRWAGTAGIVGGIALAGTHLAHPPSASPETVASTLWAWVHAMFMVSLLGGIFLLIALLQEA
jgi:hypothetical protein